MRGLDAREGQGDEGPQKSKGWVGALMQGQR